MDLGSLRALALEVNLAAHGVPVTVTLPAHGSTPIETRGLWITTITEDVPLGEFRRRDPRRVIVLSRADVPTVPKDTLIVGPEKAGDDDETWVVDGLERIEADHTRVTVVRVEA